MTAIVLDRQTAAVVAEVVKSRGVPTGIDAAHATAAALYPSMMDLRHEAAAHERKTLHVKPSEERPYPLIAAHKLTRRAAGLEPKPELANVDLFDPATQTMQNLSVAPYTMPTEEAIIEAYTARMIAAVQRHVAAAGRDLVRDTAAFHGKRYARKLGYSESGSCAFCAMMAGRGAVYATEDSAGVGKKWHDHCTCSITLVDGSEWDGRDRDLEALWDRSDGTLAGYRRVWKNYLEGQ